MAIERQVPHVAQDGRRRRDPAFQDEADAPWPTPLSAAQAAALRERQPPLSPWRVVAVQAAAGVVAALLAAWVWGRQEVGWSVLYGAAAVVVPGALMARGMTSRLSSITPGVSAVSVLLWALAKMGVTVAMLALAGRIVQPLVWPALLAGLVVGLAVYPLALRWRVAPPR